MGAVLSWSSRGSWRSWTYCPGTSAADRPTGCAVQDLPERPESGGGGAAVSAAADVGGECAGTEPGRNRGPLRDSGARSLPAPRAG